MIEIGAKGYLLKSASSSDVLGAIRKAHAGRSFLDPPVTDQLFAAFSTRGSAKGADISERELEALELVADGLSNVEIGTKLFITSKTVESHITSILGKLGATNRTEAVKKASKLGLLATEQFR